MLFDLLIAKKLGGGGSATLITKSITANGDYSAVDDGADGYSAVSVDVQPSLTTKSITENGTYNASSDNADGYSSVTVNLPDNAWKYIDGTITECVIPSGVTSIPAGAFAHRNALASIYIPNTVTSIGLRAIWNANANLCIYITSLSAWLNIDFVESWIISYHKLYENGTLITTATFPSGTTTASRAFSYNIGITSATMPDTVTTLTTGIFQYCENLTSIQLSNNITEIPSYAFTRTGITSCKIPATVTDIADASFLGSKIAILDCTELTVSNGAVNTSLLHTNAFQQTPRFTEIRFATQAIRDVYATATNWASFASMMTYVGA